jgi:uncharacterized damage-inducible protein DinB
MPISQNLLPEYDEEMSKTRKVLERCPESKFSWKPHEKSGTLSWLANHVATIPDWILLTMEQDSFDYAPPGVPDAPQKQLGTVQELLKTFDAGVAKGRAALAETSDDKMNQSWSLLGGGTVIFTMPRTAVYRSMIMNHLIHHRAQLCVYLRLNDVPMPGMYGPSADES